MELRYRDMNTQNKENNIVAARTNKRENIKRQNTHTQTELKTKLKTRINIYIESNKYYIDFGTAHALGLITTRAVMLDKPKMFELNAEQHDKLKNNPDIEIHYVYLEKDLQGNLIQKKGVEKNKSIEEMPSQTSEEKLTRLKQKIIIYEQSDRYFVDQNTAFALGMLGTRLIMLTEPKMFELTGKMLYDLKNNPDIEIEIVKVTEKLTLQIFNSGSGYYISKPAAYALGLIMPEELYDKESEYYQLNVYEFEKLKEKFKFEMHSIDLNEIETGKKR